VREPDELGARPIGPDHDHGLRLRAPNARQAVAAKGIILVEDRDIREVKNQIHHRSEMKRCANSCRDAEWRCRLPRAALLDTLHLIVRSLLSLSEEQDGPLSGGPQA